MADLAESVFINGREVHLKEAGVINAGDVSIEDEITVVVIPEGVTEIGELAFNNCESLKEITIPDSVTKIGDYAFNNCESLKEVTIPDSVTKEPTPAPAPQAPAAY